MEDIKGILQSRFTPKKPVSELWLKAEEVAKVTGSEPNRFLREIKKNEWFVRRALDELKDLMTYVVVKNKTAYFFWLLKKFKEEKKNENHRRNNSTIYNGPEGFRNRSSNS